MFLYHLKHTCFVVQFINSSLFCSALADHADTIEESSEINMVGCFEEFEDMS